MEIVSNALFVGAPFFAVSRLYSSLTIPLMGDVMGYGHVSGRMALDDCHLLVSVGATSR